ncbi:hypothetical protein CCP2SC5_190005 [Azospirillaceae bacterium]
MTILRNDLVESTLPPLREGLISRCVTINGHRTSIRLEQSMWNSLNEIALRESMSVHQVASLIDRHCRAMEGKCCPLSLTAAIRTFILAYYRQAVTEEGHRQVGHGGLPQEMENKRETRRRERREMFLEN